MIFGKGHAVAVTFGARTFHYFEGRVFYYYS